MRPTVPTDFPATGAGLMVADLLLLAATLPAPGPLLLAVGAAPLGGVWRRDRDLWPQVFRQEEWSRRSLLERARHRVLAREAGREAWLAIEEAALPAEGAGSGIRWIPPGTAVLFGIAGGPGRASAAPRTGSRAAAGWTAGRLSASLSVGPFRDTPMDESGPDQPKPYLLTEAARLTGLSADALRKRILRRRLRATRGNEDGMWRVWLTGADIEAARVGRLAGHEVDNPPEEDRTVNALEGQVETLRRALAWERERADQAGAQAATERARAAAAEREREEARIRAAAAEAEVRGLREALAEARRPFWRRWLGG